MNMKNEMTTDNFFRYYNRYSGADRYFLVFTFKKQVYLADVRHLSRTWCAVEHESTQNGGWQKWKLQPGRLPKEQLVKKAVRLMSVEEFETQRKASRKNKGYFCEMWLCENYGCTPASDKPSTRFDECGDVVYNGLQYQVKYENASLTNVNTLHNVQRDKRAVKKFK